MQFLNNLIIALLRGINVLFSFPVELGDLGVNQFQLLYFSLDVQVLVFLAFDCQLEVVDHFFVFGDVEL